MRRFGGVAAVVLVLGAIGAVAILFAVYGVGCFQLRRPTPDASAVVAAAGGTPRATSVDGSSIVATDMPSDGTRAIVETPPAVIVLAGTVVDVGTIAKDSRAPVADVAVRVGDDLTGRDVGQRPVRTAQDGTFRVELPDPGKRPLQYWLFVGPAGGQRDASLRVKLKEGQREARDLLLERFPWGDLVGTTVDPDERPIPGVHLTAEVGGLEGNPETDSDRDGRFRFENFRGLQFLEARREGYLLLTAKFPVKNREGGWEPLLVVLAPAARLHVRALDAKRLGLQAVRVEPRVSPWEKAVSKLGVRLSDEVVQWTGADGRATLDVWADQRIEICMSAPGREERTFEYESDGSLSSRASTGDRPILLHAGEEREMTALYGSDVVVRGRVVDESEQPVHPAFVLLQGGDIFDRGRLYVQQACDDGGAFAIEIPPTHELATVRLRASDKDFSWPSDRIATVDVDLQSGPTSDVVLVLHDALGIVGRVRAPDGSGVGAEVVARLESEAASKDPWGKSANTSDDGSFAIRDLEPDSYRLSVRPNETYRDTEVGSVRAGTDGTEIVLDAKRAAHVDVEVQGKLGSVASCNLWKARIRPFDGSSPTCPALSAETVFEEPGNLPRNGLFRTGASNEPIGTMSCSVVRQENGSTRLELDEGFYWFGVKGADAEGKALYPVGTGILRVASGDHKIRFVLAPSVPVEGRLLGEGVIDLHVGIARRGGSLLDLEARENETSPSRPVGAGGRFYFASVPVGDQELWIGTATELAAGKPAQRQPLTVDAKGVPFLEIQLR